MRRHPRHRSRTWREPKAVVSAKVLEIDTEIQRLTQGKIRSFALQPHWLIDKAIGFGRRALQVAWRMQETFEQTNSLAKRAHAPLQDIIEFIGPHGLPRAIKLASGVRVHRRAAKSGQIELLTSLREGPSGKPFGPQDAKNEIEKLVTARDVLIDIQRYAERQRKRLAHTRKIKDPDYEKLSFVYRLAEAWIFLTGKKPGRGRVPEHNPFLRFLECAATDAGGPPAEEWYRALISALDTLEHYERFDPKGVGSRIRGTRRRGCGTSVALSLTVNEQNTLHARCSEVCHARRDYPKCRRPIAARLDLRVGRKLASITVQNSAPVRGDPAVAKTRP
jgi:hypothetical protein